MFLGLKITHHEVHHSGSIRNFIHMDLNQNSKICLLSTTQNLLI